MSLYIEPASVSSKASSLGGKPVAISEKLSIAPPTPQVNGAIIISSPQSFKYTPSSISNDSSVPPPLPPPPQIHKSESPPMVPPPVVPRVQNNTVSGIMDNKVTDELEKDGSNEIPPIIPPKPSFSSPVGPPVVPPPVVPRQRVTSEPVTNNNNDGVGVVPPPIPPKPVR